jgi:hypothetical protein
MMQSFKVLAGKHFVKGPRDKNGRGKVISYKKGDIVKSARNLIKSFPNKFELVASESSSKLGAKD